VDDDLNKSTLSAARDWWRTSIIEMEPGVIRLRGYPIQELIGQLSYPQMLWLMLRGEIPSPVQARLFETALVAAVDHGPQAPSIAIARMAATCGIGLQGAMASAINVLGDVHGGAGEACVALLEEIFGTPTSARTSAAIDERIHAVLDSHSFVPGFGHRFHPIDPRVQPLTAAVRQAVADGGATGEFLRIGIALEAALAERKGKQIPMNIDGITAVIYAELGFAAPLARGLFVLSRSVGILAHAWEQTQSGERVKGPMPPQFLYTYSGEDQRPLLARSTTE
jgi:citrate synthase